MPSGAPCKFQIAILKVFKAFFKARIAGLLRNGPFLIQLYKALSSYSVLTYCIYT